MLLTILLVWMLVKLEFVSVNLINYFQFIKSFQNGYRHYGINESKQPLYLTKVLNRIELDWYPLRKSDIIISVLLGFHSCALAELGHVEVVNQLREVLIPPTLDKRRLKPLELWVDFEYLSKMWWINTVECMFIIFCSILEDVIKF